MMPGGGEGTAMKIEALEWLQTGRWFYLLVHTEEGITGLGEGGIHGYPEAIGGVLEAWRPYLLGQDPLRIEHHWQFLYRNSHFRGAVIGSALSALDIALWDIAGKHFGAPAYQLLGGRCREKVRLYLHVGGETPDALAADARRAADEGFTAVRFTPFPRGYPGMRYADLLEAMLQRVAAVREAVGNGVDLCVEIHRRMDPQQASGLAQELARFRPYFLEDPILPDSIQAMCALQRSIPVPIATGERLHTLWEFNELLAGGGCRFIRPDVCLCGGLTHSKKIAAVAEAYHVGVIPHNPLSPVSTAACVQLDACIPNFALQEYTGEDRPPKSEILKTPLEREGGYLKVPDRPGIGVELDLEVARRYPPVAKEIRTPLHEDGSVADA
jgi:galactonate dehydratase